MVYRHRLAGPDRRGAAAGARTRDLRLLRAKCAHELAYASARADPIYRLRDGPCADWGGALREVRAGDVVWIAPDEKHWHGAGPNTTMVHIAIHEARDGTYVDWLERVTDEQFNAAVGT